MFTPKPKPDGPYRDYYHKMVTYVGLISGPAQRIDPSATETCAIIEPHRPGVAAATPADLRGMARTVRRVGEMEAIVSGQNRESRRPLAIPGVHWGVETVSVGHKGRRSPLFFRSPGFLVAVSVSPELAREMGLFDRRVQPPFDTPPDRTHLGLPDHATSPVLPKRAQDRENRTDVLGEFKAPNRAYHFYHFSSRLPLLVASGRSTPSQSPRFGGSRGEATRTQAEHGGIEAAEFGISLRRRFSCQ